MMTFSPFPVGFTSTHTKKPQRFGSNKLLSTSTYNIVQQLNNIYNQPQITRWKSRCGQSSLEFIFHLSVIANKYTYVERIG